MRGISLKRLNAIRPRGLLGVYDGYFAMKIEPELEGDPGTKTTPAGEWCLLTCFEYYEGS